MLIFLVEYQKFDFYDFFLFSLISDVLCKLLNDVILLIAADMIVTRWFWGNLCGGEAFFMGTRDVI